MSDIETIADVVAEELYGDPSVGNVRLCIFGTKAFIDTAAYFGIDAKPLPVTAIAANRGWLEWTSTVGGLEKALFSEVELPPLPDDAWSVGIDYRGTLGGYPGHLLAVTGDQAVDITARQFARPEYRIMVPDEPLIIPWARGWMWAALGGLDMDDPADGFIMYGPHPNNDQTFRNHWEGSGNLARNVTARSIKRLKTLWRGHAHQR
jgi:hypothetical protein